MISDNYVAIPFKYFKLNNDNKIIDIVIAKHEFNNFNTENYLGRPFTEICPHFLVEQIKTLISQARNGNEVINNNHIIHTEDGNILHGYKIIPTTKEELCIFVFNEKIDKKLELNKINKLMCSELFELYPDLVCIVDCEKGKLIDVNEEFLNTYEISREELYNINLYDIIDEQYHYLTKDIKKNIKKSNVLKDLIIETRSIRSKRKYPMELRCAAIYNNGEITHLFCVLRDLQQRNMINSMKDIFIENMKLLNEVVEFEKIRTEFFSNISHEFKTPINVILGALKIMEINLNKIEEENVRMKLNNLHNSMKTNSYRLLRLVSNLLDLTRIESGYMNTNLINYDIVSLIKNITLSIKEYAIDKNIDISFHSKIDEHTIACDPEKIERIMLNLLSNAIKFTNNGDRITVSVCIDNNEVIISVKDTGIGIKEEDQRIIFERFKQVNKSFTRNNEGTGIGLSLVKSFVEMHGGRIWLKSTYKKGSEFFIGLPNKKTDNPNPYYVGIEELNIGDRVVMEFSDIYTS